MIRLLGILGIGLIMTNAFGEEAKKKPEKSALSFAMKSLSGKEVDFKKYQGKVLLVVNVASKCGYTPQYAELQSVYDKYQEKGLVVLGFPCNQFGRQEPGSAQEIAEFCSENYGVTFDMFEKVDVNGDEACDFYKFLTSQDSEPVGKGKIGWNFEKFLIGRDGQIAGRYKSGVKPTDQEFMAVIEKLLAAK